LLYICLSVLFGVWYPFLIVGHSKFTAKNAQQKNEELYASHENVISMF